MRYFLVPLSVLFLVVISTQRYNYLSANELIIFKAKRLVCAIKTPQGVLGFYDPKKELADLVPRELLSFQQYSGRKIRTIPLVNDSIVAKVGNTPISVVKVSNGWNIHLKDTTFFYQQYGIPSNQHNPKLLSSYLQEYLNPTNTWDAFVLSY
jgi:hypothetical protein